MDDALTNRSSDVAKTGIETVLIRVLGGIAASVLFGIMILTCTDVFGRYVLGAPLDGAYELTELGLAVIIFSALPIVTREREHVTVDIIDIIAGPFALRILTILTDIVSMVILFMMAWVLWERAQMIASSGLHTQSLFIPMGPIVYFMSATALLSGLALILGMFDHAAWGRRYRRDTRKRAL